MATIRDVAEAAGVSTATVSRALAGDQRISRATTRLVQQTAQRLGYQPNTVARSLRQRRSDTWALIIADIENPFLTQVTRGVEDVAHEAGYSLLLCNSDERPDKEERYLTVAQQALVRGVLITPTSPDLDVDHLVNGGLPVITLDRPARRSPGVDTVLIDTRTAAQRAVGRLIAEGRRSIGCITGPHRVFTAEERVLGYREAHEHAGISLDEDLIQYADFHIAGGRKAALRLLDDRRLDGLLVANSLMALGALEAMRERGISPGADFPIVTFDDAPLFRLLNAEVTVLRQPAYELGQTAARLLLERLDTPNLTPRTIMLSVPDPDDGR